MSKVFAALAVSVDGRITGDDPRPGSGLGDGGTLFDWYGDPRNAAVYDRLLNRAGAVLLGAGRPLFGRLPEHVRLTLADTVPGAGVVHLHYRIQH